MKKAPTLTPRLDGHHGRLTALRHRQPLHRGVLCLQLRTVAAVADAGRTRETRHRATDELLYELLGSMVYL